MRHGITSHFPHSLQPPAAGRENYIGQHVSAVISILAKYIFVQSLHVYLEFFQIYCIDNTVMLNHLQTIHPLLENKTIYSVFNRIRKIKWEPLYCRCSTNRILVFTLCQVVAAAGRGAVLLYCVLVGNTMLLIYRSKPPPISHRLQQNIKHCK